MFHPSHWGNDNKTNIHFSIIRYARWNPACEGCLRKRKHATLWKEKVPSIKFDCKRPRIILYWLPCLRDSEGRIGWSQRCRTLLSNAIGFCWATSNTQVALYQYQQRWNFSQIRSCLEGKQALRFNWLPSGKLMRWNHLRKYTVFLGKML